MKVYLAVDKNGDEWLYQIQPIRSGNIWRIASHEDEDYQSGVNLPTGFIEKLAGRQLTWDDDFYVFTDRVAELKREVAEMEAALDAKRTQLNMARREEAEERGESVDDDDDGEEFERM